MVSHLGSNHETDRVRRNTSDQMLRQIDRRTEESVRMYAHESPAVITRRIKDLKREWSVERYLQLNVSVIGLSTMALALTVNRRWGWATCAGIGFFLLHSQQGFDPPLPLLRQRGIRTRREIDEEIYALKVLRGDFDAIPPAGDGATSDDDRVEVALEAVEQT